MKWEGKSDRERRVNEKLEKEGWEIKREEKTDRRINRSKSEPECQHYLASQYWH
jgi:hypothetical protein